MKVLLVRLNWPLVLQKLGVALPALKADLEKELTRRHKVQGTSSSDVYLGQNLKKVLDAADAEARKLKDEFISAEHFLLGLVVEGGAPLKAIFKTHKVTHDALLKALARAVDLRDLTLTDAELEQARKLVRLLVEAMGA